MRLYRDVKYYLMCMRLYRDVKYYQMWHHDRYTDLQYKKAKYYSTQSWYPYWNKGPIIPDDELHCNQGCLQMTKASPTLSKSTWIDLLRESHSAPVPYPTVHHFVTEMCTCVLISGTKLHCDVFLWCMIGFVRWMHLIWIDERGLHLEPFFHTRSNYKWFLHVHSTDSPKTSSETIQ